MKKFKNPFKALADIRIDMQKKADAEGFSQLYKEATDHIFTTLSNQNMMAEAYGNDEKKYTFTPIDIDYGDGYFIFSSGTNSIITFRIKELPGWLFGIWWEKLENPYQDYVRRGSKVKKVTYLRDQVEGQFFCQWEDEIDKFRPSRSVLCKKYRYQQNWSKDFNGNDRPDAYDWMLEDVVEMLIWMRDEPDLAYYRDYTGYDLNIKYVTRTEAKKFKQEKTKWRKDEDAYQARADKLMSDKILSYFDTTAALIVDRGENISSRYELVIKSTYPGLPYDDEDNCPGSFEPGCWGWADLADYITGIENIQDEICAYKDEIEGDDYFGPGHIIWPNVDTWGANVVSDERFAELQAKTEAGEAVGLL